MLLFDRVSRFVTLTAACVGVSATVFCAIAPGFAASTCSLNKSGTIRREQAGYGISHPGAAPLLNGGLARLWNGYPSSSYGTAWLFLETSPDSYNWSAFTGTCRTG